MQTQHVKPLHKVMRSIKVKPNIRISYIFTLILIGISNLDFSRFQLLKKENTVHRHHERLRQIVQQSAKRKSKSKKLEYTHVCSWQCNSLVSVIDIYRASNYLGIVYRRYTLWYIKFKYRNLESDFLTLRWNNSCGTSLSRG